MLSLTTLRNYKSYRKGTRQKQNTTFKLRTKISSNRQQISTIHGNHLGRRNLCTGAGK